MSAIATQSNPIVKRVLLTCISLLLVFVVFLGIKITLTGEPQLLAGNRPSNLGVRAGQLAPCPSTPNCVSSQSQDPAHKIEPFTYNSAPQAAMADLQTVLQSYRRIKAIAQTENYLYTEFTIPVVGFVDDVEFFLDENARVIHVRSASRLGESDLGVNRSRIEKLRAKFARINNHKAV